MDNSIFVQSTYLDIPIFLASKSPRRVALLEMLEIPFTQIVSNEEENINPNGEPKNEAVKASKQKAASIISQIDEGIIIGADTIVIIDNQILGKPQSKKEAERFLRLLSNNTHQVITGVTVCRVPKEEYFSDYSLTDVTFRKIDQEEITAYIKTNEPFDKAGAYAIQGRGAQFIASINGCFTNVIGLPLVTLQNLLINFDISFHKFWNNV